MTYIPLTLLTISDINCARFTSPEKNPEAKSLHFKPINLEEIAMLCENLQDALEKIGSDNQYCEELKFAPDKLALDFGLSEDECISLYSGDSLNHVDKTIRPVAICCTCTYSAVEPTTN